MRTNLISSYNLLLSNVVGDSQRLTETKNPNEQLLSVPPESVDQNPLYRLPVMFAVPSILLLSHIDQLVGNSKDRMLRNNQRKESSGC